jgi:hypothetical protein
MDASSPRSEPIDWRGDHRLWVEAFIVFNFAGLIGDISLAHSGNSFRRTSEYIPIGFSAAAAVILTVGLFLKERRGLVAVWRDLGYLVGWLSVAVGLAGVVVHLDSQFFYERTIRSLTYAAPFAAPLAYAGLGLLLIVNRMIDPGTIEWAQWVLFLALGGFVGNFLFSLTDHAMNGFFRAIEWAPVVSSAFAVSFLLAVFLVPVERRFLALCALVLGVEAMVGMAGFALHVLADLGQPGATLLERLIAGAPPFAPLLFPDLVALGLIALWALRKQIPVPRQLR